MLTKKNGRKFKLQEIENRNYKKSKIEITRNQKSKLQEIENRNYKKSKIEITMNWKSIKNVILVKKSS